LKECMEMKEKTQNNTKHNSSESDLTTSSYESFEFCV
jgi:hypothetical protein